MEQFGSDQQGMYITRNDKMYGNMMVLVELSINDEVRVYKGGHGKTELTG